MGFFSGIGDIAGSLVGGAAGFALGGPSGAAIGAGLGGMFDSQRSSAAANAQNYQIAQDQMNFQARMRRTAYQDAVKDLQKAGLNPMLAYSQGGAAVPSGASAEMRPTVTPQSISSAFGAAGQLAQVQQIKAQTANINADTVTKLEAGKNAPELFGSQAREATARADKTAREAERLTRFRDLGAWEHSVDKIKADVAQSISSAENLRAANMAAKMFEQSDVPGAKELGAVLQLIFRR